jgi:glycosyltransferase involved in cell wall biosynthesis
MKICFFAPLADREAFHYNQFYAQDVRILEALSDELVLATRWSEIPWDADLYFVWWWTWAFIPMVKAKLRNRPIIITGTFDLENPMPGIGFYSRNIVQKIALRLSLLASDANIFVSEMEFERVPYFLPTKLPIYAPHVIDCDSHQLNTKSRDSFLLTVAWLNGDNVERKGVIASIKAHALLLKMGIDIGLYIAGAPGDSMPRLINLVTSLGSTQHVKFLGRISHEEKVNLMQQCAAYLQPSIFEGFGVAAAEAMACGAPVVACRGGALGEVLGPQAFYSNSQHEHELAIAISRALQPIDKGAQKAAAESIRQRFHFEVRFKAIEKIVGLLIQ